MVGSVDDDWESGLWTDAKRDAYLASGERAIAALRDHLALVAASASEDDEPRIDESAERVREAYIALSQAEFDYSSTLAPFALLESEDDEDDFEDVPLDPEAEHNQISVMIRRDYAVTSEAEIVKAGREAYLKVWPDDTPDQADEDVQDLGRALYQVMHAGGVDALDETPGLQPTAGVLLTVAREQLMSGADFESIVEQPEALFAVDGEILYSQSDVW